VLNWSQGSPSSRLPLTSRKGVRGDTPQRRGDPAEPLQLENRATPVAQQPTGCFTEQLSCTIDRAALWVGGGRPRHRLFVGVVDVVDGQSRDPKSPVDLV